MLSFLSGNKYNFDRQKAHAGLIQGTPYDYKSIMHYSRTTFTMNGKDTIRAKFDPEMPLGGQVMSQYDILELNKIYQCHCKYLLQYEYIFI